MNETKILELIDSMNTWLDDDVASTSISPTHLTGGHSSPSESVADNVDSDILISKIKDLEECEKYMLHAVLHKFYASGIRKYNDIIDVVDMHNEVKKHINHAYFDRLDEQ